MKMGDKKYCSRCGHELPEGASYCPNCGAKVDSNYTASFESRDRSSVFTDTYDQESGRNRPDQTEELLPLVFGIVSFFTGGLLFGILAVYFANKAPGGKYSGIGRALGILSMVLWILVGVIWFIYAVALAKRGMAFPMR